MLAKCARTILPERGLHLEAPSNDVPCNYIAYCYTFMVNSKAHEEQTAHSMQK